MQALCHLASKAPARQCVSLRHDLGGGGLRLFSLYPGVGLAACCAFGLALRLVGGYAKSHQVPWVRKRSSLVAPRGWQGSSATAAADCT
jgi:hypothetical protein